MIICVIPLPAPKSDSVKSVTQTVVLCFPVAQSVKHNLLAAFRYLIRPLVRIALRNGATYPEFVGVLKDAFVDVSSSQLLASGREPSADAIAVMTAIDRDQVFRPAFDAETDPDTGSDRSLSAAARLLVGWHTDREYIGPYGLVQDLEFTAASGKSKNDPRGFSELAQRYCPGFPARVLLDELIRTRCVQDLGNGFFRAITRLYVPEQLSPESIRRFAQVIHNVIETLEFNLRKAAPGAGRIERTVFADYGLSRVDLAAFNKYVRARGQIFADDMDNWLSTRSEKGEQETIQTGIGFYHYVVNEEDERDFGESLITGE